MAEGYLQWRIERMRLVDSTNRVAAERVMDCWNRGESAAGIMIVAERQSAGQGQHGRVWESPAGGLYFSAVVEDVAPGIRDKLALVAGVAAAYGLHHIERQKIQVGLRWPNDLMLAGKKVGGILCESIVQGERWAGIVGVGVNVNTHIEKLPADVRRVATSLLAHDGRRHDPLEVELHVREALASILRDVKDDGLAPVVKAARDLDVLRGKRVELRDGERSVSGVAQGLGDSGELLIRTDQGVERCALGTLMSVEDDRLR